MAIHVNFDNFDCFKYTSYGFNDDKVYYGDFSLVEEVLRRKEAKELNI